MTDTMKGELSGVFFLSTKEEIQNDNLPDCKFLFLSTIKTEFLKNHVF